MTPRQQVFDAIRETNEHVYVIAVPVEFIGLCGESDAALFLAQLLYWTERARLPGGWVYKSRQQWCDELHWTRYRFDAARRRVRDLELLEEAYHLVGARRILHMRVRHDQLCALLRARQPCGARLDTVSAAEDGRGTCPGEQDGSCGAVSSGTRTSAARNPVQRPSGRSRDVIPDGCVTEPRTVENQPFVRSDIDHPRAKTPSETPSETPSQTPSQIPADIPAMRTVEREEVGRAGKGKDLKKQRGGVPEKRTAAMVDTRRPDEHSESPVTRGAHAGGCTGLPVARHSDTLYEDRLFEMLERVPGFPSDHNYERLRELLDEYPEMDHIVAVGEFARNHENVTLMKPWGALRWCLKRRAEELARYGRHEQPRESVQVTLPGGGVRLVLVPQGRERPWGRRNR